MTRRPAPVDPPVALTIAASDSGGGAGVQADLKTMEACGVFGTSVVCAVTAQNTLGVDSIHVLPPEEIDAQYKAVASDFDLASVKTGMLATEAVIETVTGYARDLTLPLVVDPVMVAASGDRLLEPAGEDAYEALVGEATLVTPNVDETIVLTGIDPRDDDAREAGEAVVEMGAEAALIKGGHVPGGTVTDVLVTADGAERFEHPRVDTEATHGSGCTLASAIAARLAQGDALDTAVESGLSLLGRAVRYPLDVGEGPGAVHHHVSLRDRAARDPTAEAVERCVATFVERDVSPLVPEVGMNVVGATPYAEIARDIAAVEGRITRTRTGVRPNRGVRFAASSHVARFLLAAREFDPDLGFAVNCRFDVRIETALDELGWATTDDDGSDRSKAVADAGRSQMGPGVRGAFEDGETTPIAVIDRGEFGREATVKLLATDEETMVERTISLLDTLRARLE